MVPWAVASAVITGVFEVRVSLPCGGVSTGVTEELMQLIRALRFAMTCVASATWPFVSTFGTVHGAAIAPVLPKARPTSNDTRRMGGRTTDRLSIASPLPPKEVAIHIHRYASKVDRLYRYLATTQAPQRVTDLRHATTHGSFRPLRRRDGEMRPRGSCLHLKC